MKKTLLILLLSSVVSFSQNHKLSGLLFGDYFYKVSGDSSSSFTEYSQYKKDHQAFDIRRVMLIYENQISENFKAGFSLEGGNRFLLNGRFGVIIKTAFLEWKNIFPYSNLYIGYFPTPAFVWGLSEKVWGYRSVEKTVSDMRNLTTPVDLGISLRGSFNKEASYGYSLMIGNGSGLRPENNKFKKFYISLFQKLSWLNNELYFDFEPESGGRQIRTLKGIVSFEHKFYTIGTEFLMQNRIKFGPNQEDITPAALSLFAHATVLKQPKTEIPRMRVFGRFDLYNPDINLDNVYIEHFITAGIDFSPLPGVHFMPNIWINTYNPTSDSLPERKNDIVGRMTFYYIYK
ncbi:MAG: hypothetical protein N2510_03505 [Ignavibacteria bacterium]|nr:hypothetical protein [Ignavibacteria bacterium]